MPDLVEGNLRAAAVLGAPLFEMPGQCVHPPLDVLFAVGAGAASAGCALDGCRDQCCEEYLADLRGIVTRREVDGGLVPAPV